MEFLTRFFASDAAASPYRSHLSLKVTQKNHAIVLTMFVYTLNFKLKAGVLQHYGGKLQIYIGEIPNCTGKLLN